MKRYEIKNKPVPTLKEVKCDGCGKDCLNSFIDIQLKFSFISEPELFKTLCYSCYEKIYGNELIKLRKERFNSKFENQKQGEDKEA